MTNLKNVNFMNKSQFEDLPMTEADELYAVTFNNTPDYSSVISIASGFVAVEDGFAFVSKNGSGGNDVGLTIKVDNCGFSHQGGYAGSNAARTIPLRKGQTITWSVSGGGTFQAIFVPCI